jgi:hypothetical protein
MGTEPLLSKPIKRSGSFPGIEIASTTIIHSLGHSRVARWQRGIRRKSRRKSHLLGYPLDLMISFFKPVAQVSLARGERVTTRLWPKNFMITEKKTGVRKMPNKVTPIIPLKTAVPSACRSSAPGPLATTKGNTPSVKANDVIKIGRSRTRAASVAAVKRSWPRSISCLANSTIKIAFLQANPTSTNEANLSKNIIVHLTPVRSLPLATWRR